MRRKLHDENTISIHIVTAIIAFRLYKRNILTFVYDAHVVFECL